MKRSCLLGLLALGMLALLLQGCSKAVETDPFSLDIIHRNFTPALGTWAFVASVIMGIINCNYNRGIGEIKLILKKL